MGERSRWRASSSRVIPLYHDEDGQPFILVNGHKTKVGDHVSTFYEPEDECPLARAEEATGTRIAVARIKKLKGERLSEGEYILKSWDAVWFWQPREVEGAVKRFGNLLYSGELWENDPPFVDRDLDPEALNSRVWVLSGREQYENEDGDASDYVYFMNGTVYMNDKYARSPCAPAAERHAYSLPRCHPGCASAVPRRRVMIPKRLPERPPRLPSPWELRMDDPVHWQLVPSARLPLTKPGLGWWAAELHTGDRVLLPAVAAKRKRDPGMRLKGHAIEPRTWHSYAGGLVITDSHVCSCVAAPACDCVTVRRSARAASRHGGVLAPWTATHPGLVS